MAKSAESETSDDESVTDNQPEMHGTDDIKEYDVSKDMLSNKHTEYEVMEKQLLKFEMEALHHQKSIETEQIHFVSQMKPILDQYQFETDVEEPVPNDANPNDLNVDHTVHYLRPTMHKRTPWYSKKATQALILGGIGIVMCSLLVSKYHTSKMKYTIRFKL
eukprot:47307_1